MSSPSWRPAAGIALVSCAVLLFEIALTRILSVVLYYHFAFLAIALAMLGLAAPGVWFSLRPPGPRALERALFASAASVPLSLVALFKLAPALFASDSLRPLTAPLGTGGEMAFYVLCVLPPFLCLGAAVCLFLLEAPGAGIARIYGADLLGATAGALLVLPLMKVAPTPHLAAAAGFLPLAAAALLRRGSPRAAAALAAALAVCLVWSEPFRVRYTKSYVETRAPIYEKWGPTARITIFDRLIWAADPAEAWGWGFHPDFRPPRLPAPELWIDQDGAAGTPLPSSATDPGSLEYLFFDVTSVACQVRPPASVCVIGAGGGRDVLTVLRAGARSVDAVELNGAIVEAVSGPLRDRALDVYHLPGVTAVVGEGRSYLTRTSRRYDLIQISLVDSWATTAAGAYALSENHLYTIEALRCYWERLNPGGMISLTRWASGKQQMESARLALLAESALQAMGVAEPRRHLAFFSAGFVGTLLIAREPLGPPDFQRMDQVCAERGFARHWPPGAPESSGSPVARVLTEGPAPFERAGFNLSPPDDDRPFFFQTVSLLRGIDPQARFAYGSNEQSVQVLRGLLASLSVLSAALFLLPVALRGHGPRSPSFWRGCGYFAAIGLAFLLVEVALVQRCILYLGHPSYAATVVLAALLLGSGSSALGAARLSPAWRVRAVFAAALLVIALHLASPAIFGATMQAPLGARMALVFALAAPAGAAMGVAFPAGMLRFGDQDKAWFWAVNGAFGVLATVLAVGLSIERGFSFTTLTGAACYLAAGWLLGDPRRGAAGS